MAASEQLYVEFLLQELTSVITTPSSSEAKSSTAEICVPAQQFPRQTFTLQEKQIAPQPQRKEKKVKKRVERELRKL